MAQLFMCDMCGATVRADKYLPTYLPVVVEKTELLFGIPKKGICALCVQKPYSKQLSVASILLSNTIR